MILQLFLLLLVQTISCASCQRLVTFNDEIYIIHTYIYIHLYDIDRELLKPSATVALHRQSHALVDVLPPEADSTIPLLAV